MSTNDQNVKPEQRRPKDVGVVPEKPPAVQPAGVRDKSERPVVNPITGVAS
ncbi:hypothetical protein HLI18_09010 [Rhizobium laguerreae]|uniref:hypothetical protein n=1 Tax=Rhizobium laguerreae TaxID=1076926 RepID=UPI00147879B8|nr:hypothetical protein [Rhizobium laguerreae]NNG70057.1 hypothetical protein [Rhizobium laguerreae]